MAKDSAAAAPANEDLPSRVAAAEQRITAIEQLLASKIPGFEQVGTRVTELSGAFLAANQRLTALEAAVSALAAAPSPVDEQRITAIEATVSSLSATVTQLAATRGRSGLSGRLRGIEEKLDLLLPPATPEAP